MALAVEKLWHYWIAWALVIGTVLTLVALVVGYLVKVESPSLSEATAEVAPL